MKIRIEIIATPKRKEMISLLRIDKVILGKLEWKISNQTNMLCGIKSKTMSLIHSPVFNQT